MPTPKTVTGRAPKDTSARIGFRLATTGPLAIAASIVVAAALWPAPAADAVPSSRIAGILLPAASAVVDADTAMGLTLEPMGFYQVPEDMDLLVTEWLPWFGDLADQGEQARPEDIVVRFSIDGIFETDWRGVRNAVLVRSGDVVRNPNRYRVRMDGVYLDHEAPAGAPGAGELGIFADNLLAGIEAIQERMIERNAEAMRSVLRAAPAPPPVIVVPAPGSAPDEAPRQPERAPGAADDEER